MTETSSYLGFTILYVPDVEAATTFYEQTFGLRRRFVTDAQEYGELNTGTTHLAFSQSEFAKGSTSVPFEAAQPDKSAPPVELGIVTKDVAALYQRAIQAGATPVQEPEPKPWGQIVGYVRDLNGFLVEICTEVQALAA
ncbi:VOC family protein [Phormidium sp. FACHB-592]|uniref:VOC family protein n=1 Tax=Stenomitos frigidus AS-A4 TaxID=2933935 RepID=A0ABV0KSH8_9CYAN|nr:VOC family protein [Phormidium sp. FACHB-592]MBD2074604.1 VOC family protein [Phormidium sp. FACHB-592]